MKLSLLLLPNITTRLGTSLLLLLATTTTLTTLTLAQDCDPTAVVDDNTCVEGVSYCSNTSKTCLAIGSCAENNAVIDCSNINNGPYPVTLCMGTMECTDDGMCSINCSLVPVMEKDPTPTFETNNNNETLSSCMTSSECNNMNMNMSSSMMDNGSGSGPNKYYCGSDSTCMPMGDCLIIDDCTMNMDNFFPVAACMGNMECTDEGRCSMNCGPNDNDALFADDEDDVLASCSSSSDCVGGIGIDYCTLSDNICLPVGSCSYNTDCTNNIDNSPFAIDMCIGTLECVEGTCSQICDTTTPCTVNNDCNIDNEYYDNEITGDGICLQMGQCNIVDDCTNMNNIYAIVQCIGTLSCTVDGQCSKICDGITTDTDTDTDTDTEEEIQETLIPIEEEEEPITVTTPATSCRTSNECSNDGTEYCDAIISGTCLKMGSCSTRPNCFNINNMFAISTCVGTLSCIDGQCTQVCQSSNNDSNTRPDSASAMEAPMSTTCKTNTDCITYEGTELIPLPEGGYERRNGSYCAQGVCMDMGRCNSNSDCSNPINLFDDKRCIGYLSCGGDDVDDGTCTRICGTPCEDGSQKQVECTVDPCLKNDGKSCSGAVSCIVDLCGCTAVHYDSSGEVITDCEYVDEATTTSTTTGTTTDTDATEATEATDATDATSSVGAGYGVKEGGAVTTTNNGETLEASGGSASLFYQRNIIAISASAVVVVASSSLLLIISIL